MRTVLLLLTLAAGLHAELEFRNIVFRDTEDGGAISASKPYKPGETVHLDFQVAGYGIAEKELLKSVNLTWEVEVFDPKGVLVIQPTQGEFTGQLEPEDKAWLPKVRVNVELPAWAIGGRYRVKAQINDKIANKQYTRDISFTVNGPELPAADVLLLTDLAFYRDENFKNRLSTPAYRAGDPVFIQGEALGFQLKDNAPHLTLSVAVLAPDGKQVVPENESWADQEGGYYPKKVSLARGSIRLDRTAPKGTYTLVLTLRDQLAGTSYTTKAPFSLE